MALSNYEKVRSTNIDAVAYDRDTKELRVRFTNGGEYSYAGVPQELVDGMKAAASPGGYFGARIRTAFKAVKL